MYLRWINKHDRMDDLPETFNENMQKIEQAMTDLQFEIAHIKDDIEHLKILAREDDER
jgi:uncharacterized protein YukE